MGANPGQARRHRFFWGCWSAAIALGLGVAAPAQIKCPPPDGSGLAREYGVTCGAEHFIVGATLTPYTMSPTRLPGNESASENRLLTASGQPVTTRLTDAQLQAVLTAGQSRLDAEVGDLYQHFAGAALDYRSAADQFTAEAVARAQAPLQYFLAAAASHPENRDAVLGLLDTQELLAQRWIVRGNEQLAEALYRRYQQTGFDLFQVNNGLRDAHESFRQAVAGHTKYFNLPLARGMAPTLYELTLRHQPDRRDYTGKGFRDLRLFAQAAGRLGFTRRELGQRLFALRRYGETYDTLARAELDGLGHLLIVAPAYESVAADNDRLAINQSLRELLAERSRTTTLLRHLEGGKNVIGLDDSYVEFRFNREIHDPRFNNFTQVRLWTESRLNDAQRSYTEFRAHSREFEQTVASYRLQLQQHLDVYNREIQALCGTPDPATCNGGLIREARLNIDQANLRIEAVLQEISNLQARISNMLEASDALRAIREQIAQMEIAHAGQRATLIEEMARLQAEAARERAELERRRQIDLSRRPQQDREAGRIAGDAAVVQGGIDADLARRTGELQAQMERLQALQRAEFVRLEDRTRAVEVQRFIKDTTLDIISRRIDLRMAQLGLTQAAALLDDRNQQLRRALTEQQTWRGLDSADDRVFRDPTLRIIRDEYLRQYLADYEEAQRRVYLSGRALAYEINRCSPNPANPGDTCPPLVRNLDDVLQIVDLNAMRNRLNDMNELMIDHETRYRTEVRRSVIDLSKLMGFRKATIAGADRSAKAQFRDCLHALVERRALPPYCPPCRPDVCPMEGRDPDPVTTYYRTVVFRFPIEIGVHLQDLQDPDYEPVVSPLLANLRIRSIKARIEGPATVLGRYADLPLAYGLTDVAGNLIGSMSQRGPDSNIRFTDLNGRDHIRRYNAIGAGTATIPAGVGTPSFDAVTAFSEKFLYRTLAFDKYRLVLSVNRQLYPDNPSLIPNGLSSVEDVKFEFTCDTFTLP